MRPTTVKISISLVLLTAILTHGCGGRNVTAPGEEESDSPGAAASNVAEEPDAPPVEPLTPPPVVIAEPATPPVEPLCRGANGELHPGPCLDGVNGLTPTIEVACQIVGQGQSGWPAIAMEESLFATYSSNNGADHLPYFLQVPQGTTIRRRAGEAAPRLSVVRFADSNRNAGRGTGTRNHVHNGIVLFSVPVSLPANRQSIQDDATFSATLNLNFYKEDSYRGDTELLSLLNQGQRKSSGSLFTAQPWPALNNTAFGPVVNTLFNVQIASAMHQTANTRTGGRPLALELKELFAEGSRALTTSQVLDILYSGVPAGATATSGDVISTLQFAVSDDVMILEGSSLDVRYNKQVCPPIRVVTPTENPAPAAATTPPTTTNAGEENATAGVQ